MEKIQPQKVDEHTWLVDTGLNRPGHTACYLVEANGELAFIDCGASTSVPRLLHALEELELRPEQVRYVLPTHVHLDHAGGAGRLLSHCPDATLATHHKGLPHLVDPGRLQAGAMAVYGEAAFQRLFGDLAPAPESRCRSLEEGDTLPLGDTALQFLDTPGHANHHGCFFDPRGANLFTGDAFGLRYPELDAAGKPFLLATTTPVAFEPDAWKRSLEKMMALNPHRACLTHFGPLERPARWAPLLVESLEAHVAIALAEEADPRPGREARLQSALRDHFLKTARQRGLLLDEASLDAILGIDIDLNAQGLDVWLARRARKREKSL